MDDTDFSLFGKKKSKHDKADASASNSKGSGDNSLAAAQEETFQKIQIVSHATDEDTYNSDYPRVGIAVILNHKTVKGQKPREGTEKDRDEMHKTLLRYGFDVRVYNDLTFQEISDELKKTAEEDHTQSDCFVLVVMSHGAEGRVYAKDMSYPAERLWNPFLGNNCKDLINKPKIFFIQACRGENLDKPVVFTQARSFATMSRGFDDFEAKPQVVNYAIPSTADILVMYSTFEKFFSFRNVENGSWFIQGLCEVLNNTAEKEAASKQGAELLRLLTAVNRKVAYEYQSFSNKEALDQMKEMPNFLSTLTKTFYLKVKPKTT